MSTDRVGGSGIVRRHKATHATGGTDALTPADIGAVANSLINAPSGVLGLDGSGAVSNPTFTGVASFPDGSASAPSITNTGDTNTGIAFPAADTVAISTGGTERVRVTDQGASVVGVDSTGFAGLTARNNNANVGIAGIEFGSDSTYSKAAIGQVRSGPNGHGALVFYVDSNNDAADWAAADEKMRLDANGQLGLGVTPGYPLDVAANASTQGIRLRGRAADGLSVIEFRDSTAATYHGAISTSPTSLAIVQAPGGVPTTRMQINSAGLITGTGTSLGTWVSFTPSWTNVTLGTGANNFGYYCQIGKVVVCRVQLILGTGGDVTGRIELAPPISMRSVASGYAVARAVDTSLSTPYALAADVVGGTAYFQSFNGTTGAMQDTSATVPFDWTDGDRIQMQYVIEAA